MVDTVLKRSRTPRHSPIRARAQKCLLRRERSRRIACDKTQPGEAGGGFAKPLGHGATVAKLLVEDRAHEEASLAKLWRVLSTSYLRFWGKITMAAAILVPFPEAVVPVRPTMSEYQKSDRSICRNAPPDPGTG